MRKVSTWPSCGVGTFSTLPCSCFTWLSPALPLICTSPVNVGLPPWLWSARAWAALLPTTALRPKLVSLTAGHPAQEYPTAPAPRCDRRFLRCGTPAPSHRPAFLPSRHCLQCANAVGGDVTGHIAGQLRQGLRRVGVIGAAVIPCCRQHRPAEAGIARQGHCWHPAPRFPSAPSSHSLQHAQVQQVVRAGSPAPWACWTLANHRPPSSSD